MAHFKTDTFGSKFPPTLHFVRKFKIPWILKWQYVIVEDKLKRHWYVKWWDKCPQIDTIIQNVKELVQAPRAQIYPSNAPHMLLTLDACNP